MSEKVASLRVRKPKQALEVEIVTGNPLSNWPPYCSVPGPAGEKCTLALNHTGSHANANHVWARYKHEQS